MAIISEKVYNRMIPVVLGIPVLFLILFIVVSMFQLRDINNRIEEGESQGVRDLISGIAADESLSETRSQFMTLAILEEESLSERYRQGHYAVVSRSFKQFLGFFTGIIMVIVGSVFILLKLRENIDADAAKGEGWKFKLVTNSPGVVFGIIGAILIGFASNSNDKISVRDSGLYLTREYLVAPFFNKKVSQQGLEAYMKNHGQVTYENPNDSILKQQQDPNQEKIGGLKIKHPPKNNEQ